MVTGNKTTARLILARSIMQGLQSGGNSTEFTYHWYAITTDDNGLNSNNPADDCYIKYNPLGPSAPTLTRAQSALRRVLDEAG